jgi:3-hydroxy acid dehydrogenase / malonic semialdehyde reductase
MKTILVTGASAGIGAACVREFERRGNRVVALARRAERLSTLKSKDVHVCTCDVNDHDAVRAALTSLPESHREIDVLVNNAGLALGMAKAQDSTWEDWSTMIETNVRALTFVTHLLLPGMVKRNRGHVVNLGSVAGTYPYQGGNVYAATKAYVEQFTLALRADLHGTRVRVTNIEPGVVATEFSETRFKGDSERASKVYEGLEALTAQDIAETVAYVVDLPERVNVNRLELMSVAQSFAGFVLDRKVPT